MSVMTLLKLTVAFDAVLPETQNKVF